MSYSSRSTKTTDISAQIDTDGEATHTVPVAQRSRIAAGFANLRKKGYFAYMKFGCCNSSAWTAIPEERLDRVVFFSMLENEIAFEGGHVLKQPLCLDWNGDAAEICRAFIKQGLLVDWDGKQSSCIQILPPGALPDSAVAMSQ